jgi:LemA protein
MKKLGLLGCGVVLLIVIVIGAAVAMFAMSNYNVLVSSQEGVNTAWAQVENVYQRRADLIPNLVNTVKGVANFEKDTYTAVTEARSRVGQIKVTPEMLNDPNALAQYQKAQGELGSAISRLLVVAENYPELKANQNFLELQSQLEGTENRIAVERKRFNEVAQGYNVLVRTFPRNIIANFFGFKQKAYFAAAEGADKAPEVKF